jgi:hypothetical protein
VECRPRPSRVLAKKRWERVRNTIFTHKQGRKHASSPLLLATSSTGAMDEGSAVELGLPGMSEADEDPAASVG